MARHIFSTFGHTEYSGASNVYEKFKFERKKSGPNPKSELLQLEQKHVPGMNIYHKSKCIKYF